MQRCEIIKWSDIPATCGDTCGHGDGDGDTTHGEPLPTLDTIRTTSDGCRVVRLRARVATLDTLPNGNQLATLAGLGGLRVLFTTGKVDQLKPFVGCIVFAERVAVRKNGTVYANKRFRVAE